MKHILPLIASLFATFSFLFAESNETLQIVTTQDPAVETEQTHSDSATAVVSTKDLTDDVNRISEDINSKIREYQQTDKMVAAAAGNPKYTSKAVEEKRKAVREAEVALLKAQEELRAEIANLPEIKKIAEENTARQKEIAALREKKKEMQELLRKRSRTSDSP